MSTDDAADERTDAEDGAAVTNDSLEGVGGGDADTAVAAELDDRLVDLLAWVLDTETRARIYVYLRGDPASTSREVAEGTGLYPSTVREALAELNGDGTVTRRKREAGGAGNNPYEYVAIPPADLVVGVIDRVEDELNTVYNLDERLAGRCGDEDPITITVDADREGRASERAGTGPSGRPSETDAVAGRGESEPVGADDD